MRWRTASNVLLVGLLVVGIWLPLMGQMLGDQPGSEQTERRRAAAWPTLEVRMVGSIPWPRKKSLQSWPDAFEAWYNDHFGFRRALIRHYNLAVVKGFMPAMTAGSVGKARPESPALVGRDGWLFSTRDEELETYRCARPFSRQQLDTWTHVLLERQAWLAERGIHYLFVVPPSKAGVYTEYLPRAIQRVSPRSRVEELERCLKQQGAEGLLLNLQPALVAAKVEYPQHPLFYRTDTHWNALGAYIGYCKVMQHLQRWFPARPSDLSEFDLSQHEGPPLVLAQMLDTAELFQETHVVLQPRLARQARTVELSPVTKNGVERSMSENPAAPLGHAVVLHDSFLVDMQPLLNEHWRQVHYFWTQDFPHERIERLRPDVVIQEMVEYFVTIHSPRNPSGMQVPSERLQRE